MYLIWQNWSNGKLYRFELGLIVPNGKLYRFELDWQTVYRFELDWQTVYRFELGVIVSNGKLYIFELHSPSMLPDKAKFVVCSIISLALSFGMKHLPSYWSVTKTAKFSAFHWSTSRSQAFIGQLLGTSRVEHLLKHTIMVLFTILDA